MCRSNGAASRDAAGDEGAIVTESAQEGGREHNSRYAGNTKDKDERLRKLTQRWSTWPQALVSCRLMVEYKQRKPERDKVPIGLDSSGDRASIKNGSPGEDKKVVENKIWKRGKEGLLIRQQRLRTLPMAAREIVNVQYK